MNKIIKFTPGSDEWLQARQKYLTATELSVILGMNKYGSIREIQDGKRGEVKRLDDNVYLRAGRLLEPSVFLALSEAGISCKPADPDKVVMAVDDEVRLSCSLDGKAVHPLTGESVIMEAKSTGKAKFAEWFRKPPINYLVQVQAQLMLMGREVGLLTCMSTEFPFHIIVYEVRANAPLRFIFEEAAVEFWKAFNNDDLLGIDVVKAAECVRILETTFSLIGHTELNNKRVDFVRDYDYYNK